MLTRWTIIDAYLSRLWKRMDSARRVQLLRLSGPDEFRRRQPKMYVNGS